MEGKARARVLFLKSWVKPSIHKLKPREIRKLEIDNSFIHNLVCNADEKLKKNSINNSITSTHDYTIDINSAKTHYSFIIKTMERPPILRLHVVDRTKYLAST